MASAITALSASTVPSTATSNFVKSADDINPSLDASASPGAAGRRVASTKPFAPVITNLDALLVGAASGTFTAVKVVTTAASESTVNSACVAVSALPVKSPTKLVAVTFLKPVTSLLASTITTLEADAVPAVTLSITAKCSFGISPSTAAVARSVDANSGSSWISIIPVSERVITILSAFPTPPEAGSFAATKDTGVATSVSTANCTFVASVAVSALPVTSPVKSPTNAVDVIEVAPVMTPPVKVAVPSDTMDAVIVPAEFKLRIPVTSLLASTDRTLSALAVPAVTPSTRSK